MQTNCNRILISEFALNISESVQKYLLSGGQKITAFRTHFFSYIPIITTATCIAHAAIQVKLEHITASSVLFFLQTILSDF